MSVNHILDDLYNSSGKNHIFVNKHPFAPSVQKISKFRWKLVRNHFNDPHPYAYNHIIINNNDNNNNNKNNSHSDNNVYCVHLRMIMIVFKLEKNHQQKVGICI